MIIKICIYSIFSSSDWVNHELNDSVLHFLGTWSDFKQKMCFISAQGWHLNAKCSLNILLAKSQVGLIISFAYSFCKQLINIKLNVHFVQKTCCRWSYLVNNRWMNKQVVSIKEKGCNKNIYPGNHLFNDILYPPSKLSFWYLDCMTFK